MAHREAINVRADVVAGHAAGLSVDELCGIYGLDRRAVDEILADAADDEAPTRKSRWLSVVTGRRRRRASGDVPHSAAG
jgi:hypothetical protein